MARKGLRSVLRGIVYGAIIIIYILVGRTISNFLVSYAQLTYSTYPILLWETVYYFIGAFWIRCAYFVNFERRREHKMGD